MPESGDAEGKDRLSSKRERVPRGLGNGAAPQSRGRSVANRECSLHQLAPYIGKLKSAIARELILAYSRVDDLIADPFSGAGTIPLEALLASRRIFAADVSP